MSNNVVRLQQPSRVFITPVTPEDVDLIVPRIRKMLGKAVERQSRNLGINDVISDLYSGRSALWLVYIGDTLVAMVTTSIVRHPRRSTLFIEFVGGSRMKEWMDDMIDMLKDVAKRAGLAAIETDGRKGFERLHPDSFRIVHSHYEMEL